jgi:hypothetical protein
VSERKTERDRVRTEREWVVGGTRTAQTDTDKDTKRGTHRERDTERENKDRETTRHTDKVTLWSYNHSPSYSAS